MMSIILLLSSSACYLKALQYWGLLLFLFVPSTPCEMLCFKTTQTACDGSTSIYSIQYMKRWHLPKAILNFPQCSVFPVLFSHLSLRWSIIFTVLGYSGITYITLCAALGTIHDLQGDINIIFQYILTVGTVLKKNMHRLLQMIKPQLCQPHIISVQDSANANCPNSLSFLY